jgi:calcium-dependent protein kinase
VCTSRKTKQQCALKTIPKRRKVYVEMMRKEIDLIRSLRHPNIIKLVDAFEEERVVHMVFEMCTGGELFEPIEDRRVRFSERQASRIMRKIFEVVRYLHTRNIVHRDLKPENVLFERPGLDSDIKVIDFGLATLLQPGRTLRDHVGTPYYIAPEVLERHYGAECDLWSCGVILFTLLASYPPFYGENEAEIYERVRVARVDLESDAWSRRSHEVRDLIQQLLRRFPAERLSVEAALTHRWIVHEGECSEDMSLQRTFARVFARLRRVAGSAALKRLALFTMASRMAPQETAREQALFVQLDRDSDGAVGVEDLRGLLATRGAEIPIEEIEAMVDALDIDRDGKVGVVEITAALMSRLVYLRADNIRQVFDDLDKSEDGILSLDDLAAAVPKAPDPRAFAEELLESGDLDQDHHGGGKGYVTFPDLVRIVVGNERETY